MSKCNRAAMPTAHSNGLRTTMRYALFTKRPNKLIRFTDYQDIKYRSRPVFSFFRPETLRNILQEPNTLRNNMKHFPPLDETGFRKCQINAIQALDRSFAENPPQSIGADGNRRRKDIYCNYYCLSALKVWKNEAYFVSGRY